MLRRMFLIGCLTLSGCAADDPVECAVAEVAIFACMGSEEAKQFMTGGDTRAFFERCIPMSEPEILHGTWSTDFEFNVFREDEVVEGERAFQIPKRWAELVVAGTRLERLWSADAAQAYEVTFVGRKPLCNLTEPVTQILVDRVTSVRVLEKLPSMHL
jgi:hypothetical protein